MKLVRMVDGGKKVIFDDANKTYPYAKLYKRVPFLFWSYWSYVCDQTMTTLYHTLKSEGEIIEALLEKEAYKIRRRARNNEFNSGRKK